MGGLAKRLVKRWLRLPPDPLPPAGSAESVRVFHPAAGYFRYAVARWGLRQVGILIGFLFAFTLGSAFFDWASLESKAVTRFIERTPALLVSLAKGLRLIDIQPVPDAPDSTRISFGIGMLWLEVSALALYFVQLPLTYALVRLDYELRFYIVTDRSLRIREGITGVRESTMTFDNIQNLSIRQGPIQRIFGISDLRVRTAGGGSSDSDDESQKHGGGDAGSMHIGYFRGVDNAEQLRDTILARLKLLKDSGIGDASPPLPADGSTLLNAAHRVLEETQALRAHLKG